MQNLLQKCPMVMTAMFCIYDTGYCFFRETLPLLLIFSGIFPLQTNFLVFYFVPFVFQPSILEADVLYDHREQKMLFVYMQRHPQRMQRTA